MTCSGCEMRIENALKKLDGVKEVKAIYSNSNVYVTYDADATGLKQIIESIEKLGYIVRNKPGAPAYPGTDTKTNTKKSADDRMTISQLLGTGIVIFSLYVIIKNTAGFNFIPDINPSMGYGILFLVGLLTSLHCIAMCGGINLSQCVSYKIDGGNPGKPSKLSRLSQLKPSLLYNSGRVVSYTLIGGIAGGLGSGINFSGAARGIVAVISGVFMIIIGLNMLNVFPWLRKFNPRMPKIFGNKISNSNVR